MSSQDIISVDQYADYADQGAGSYVKMKEIRLCVDLMKKARSQGIPVGHFFTFDANVGKNETPIMTDIGASFDCVVLRDAKRVEVYDKDSDKYIVSSSEFRSMVDPVVLYDSTITDDRDEVVACLPYTNKNNPELSIMHLKATRYPNLRMKYTAYVLYEGEVYKMGFAATDNTGCLDKEFKPRGFDDPNANSFLAVQSRCHSEAGSNVMLSHVVRVSAIPAFKGAVDLIKGFEIVGRVTADRQDEITEALASMAQAVMTRFQKKTMKAWQNTLDKEAVVCADPRHIPYLVQHPDIFVQKQKMPALAPGVVVAEIEAPAPAAPRKSAAQDVIDVAADLGGDEDDAPQFVKKPDMSQKPRNRDQAIQQKREEKEYIDKSGEGAAHAAAAAATIARAQNMEAKKADPGLQEFLKQTDVPAQKPKSSKSF